MNVIAEIRREKEDLARVLKKHPGIRKLVEDIYPDRAHFIYELLQNAEDADATEATFTLEDDHLIFDHNGRPFSKEDIDAITDIGEGTKAEDTEKIGRFGVGFKAVFAYCETPSIWSPTFSFKISELVLPHEIPSNDDLDQKTRFEFPFNNPKKEPGSAYDEIRAGLDELAETTLLFLTNLESISWRIGEADSGVVLKIQHSDDHLEVLKQVGGRTTESCHFLKFSAPVEGLGKQNVAVAFELDFLPDIKQFESSEQIARQLRITPASPGRVAVFFPAEKETSGLRFHLHAPFVPELSRASVKETPANNPLFDQLAELAASSLHEIRDLGLLTREFLGALPNRADQIPARYQCIREAIVEEMKRQPLTPAHGGEGHAAASQMLQARATLKNLLTNDDLAFLHGTEKHWAVAATQRNNEVDRFLQQLEIQYWDTDEFLDHIDEALARDDSDEWYFDANEFWNWLSGKTIEWHQKFYSVLWELEGEYKLHHARDLPLVRLANGKYGKGKESFFSDETSTDADLMPRVDAGVYTSGKNKKQQDDARKYLEAIGVREVGEREQVEAILRQRYTYEAELPDEKTYRTDLKRFIAVVESDPGSAPLFHDYYVVEGKDGWDKPSKFFLDHPILETGLLPYYRALGDDAGRAPLSDAYTDRGIPSKRLASFLSAIGIQKELPVRKQFVTSQHPNSDELLRDYRRNTRRTHTEIDDDWIIPHLSKVLATPSYEMSKLIWSRLQTTPLKVFEARYRPNQQYPLRRAPSTLCLTLQRTAWVPQNGGSFVRPAEASRDLLPGGFPFDPEWQWLKAINFGAEVAKRSEVQQRKKAVAKELGFEDDDTLERAKQFALMPPEEQKRVLADFEDRQKFELPEHEPSNPDRRAQRVGAMAAEAPGRRTEVRNRSVSVGLEAVKEEAGQYLSQQYTNPDGEMICQACKKPLPFKLDDGTSFFERVQFLGELRKRHYQNYLALCPNHAAMFQHTNGSRDQLMNMVNDANANELEIILAQRPTQVYFTKTHLSDLRALIQAEDEHDDSKGGDDE
jgi:hypothetical protein